MHFYVQTLNNEPMRQYVTKRHVRDLRSFSPGVWWAVLPLPSGRWKQSPVLQKLATSKGGPLSSMLLLHAWESGNCGTTAKWELSSAMQLLSWLETRQGLGKLPHATPSQVPHIKGVFFLTRERSALPMCLMNPWFLQRGCWHSCQLAPFVMHANDYRVFSQAKRHVTLHSLLS